MINKERCKEKIKHQYTICTLISIRIIHDVFIVVTPKILILGFWYIPVDI